MKAILAASFDPPTLGHEDLIRRESKIFDKLYVGIGKNNKKKPYLPIKSRQALLERICKEYSNVEVVSFDGLLVEYCREHEGSRYYLFAYGGREFVCVFFYSKGNTWTWWRY